MIELFKAPDSQFIEARRVGLSPPERGHAFHHARLSDGSDYLRWPGLFEFLVSPEGRRIAGFPHNGRSQEAFQTYLIGQVLSFALLKQGIESLHATVVVANNAALAFLGDSGYGKSSLGAGFLAAGDRLLTDDLLVVTEKDRRFFAHPGPRRIKLFPETAAAVLGKFNGGTPMNPTTTKLVIPLLSSQSTDITVPLRAVYVLSPPARRARKIAIRPLSQQEACLALITNAYNSIVTEPARLARQFNWAARTQADWPVKSMAYPGELAQLPGVGDAGKADLMA